MVGSDGVQFDMLGYQPLDMDWGCSLEGFLTDPHCRNHLLAHFPPGTADEVEAAVIAELKKLGRPVPPRAAPAPQREPASPAPPQAPPASPGIPEPKFLLTAGTGDAAALAFAQLVARVAQAAGLAVTAVGPIAWAPPLRVTEYGPVHRHARFGGLTVTEVRAVSDGIGGPTEQFEEFEATAPGIRATWNGNLVLRVRVRAPADRVEAVRAVLPEPNVVFEDP